MHGVVHYFIRVNGADLVTSNPFDEARITLWTSREILSCDSNHKTFLIHRILICQVEGLLVDELSYRWALPLNQLLQLDHAE